MGVGSKIKTLVWFAVRPKYWIQTWGILVRSFNRAKEESREEAGQWAEQMKVTEMEAVEKLFSGQTVKNPKEVYPDVFKKAHEVTERVPVTMGGAGNLNMLYSMALQLKPLSAIETGVAYGWSSLTILLAIAKNNGKLISIDMPYVKMNNEDFVGCAVPDDLKQNWKLIREADRTGLKKAIQAFRGKINLCHYDSDKSYAGRMWAYPKLWKSLEPGGIFISDDIGDNTAFREFSEQVNVEPIVVKDGHRFIGILKKP